jgi:hypothetical protein
MVQLPTQGTLPQPSLLLRDAQEYMNAALLNRRATMPFLMPFFA